MLRERLGCAERRNGDVASAEKAPCCSGGDSGGAGNAHAHPHAPRLAGCSGEIGRHAAAEFPQVARFKYNDSPAAAPPQAQPMKKVVERERNKTYYRVLHLPIWLWVFFVLPGWPLTYAMYTTGFDSRHALWFALVFAVCAWRGFAGRLPGVEHAPYVIHFGVDQPNLWYRVVCYTAAWIAIVVPFALNVIGLVVASFTGEWMIQQMYQWLYYPLALLVVLATSLDLTPRARRSTLNEGAERAWFYVGLWRKSVV